MKEFAVKSESFPLYEAFKKEAEKRGWVYRASFSGFNEENAESYGLYFNENWENGNPQFAFSSSSDYLQLETQWNEAIKALEIAPPKVTITIQEIAEWKGCRVEDITIKLNTHGI